MGQSVQLLWEELKTYYERYKICIEKHEKSLALKKETEKTKNILKALYGKLKISMEKLRRITATTKSSKLDARDIVNLASQFPLTKHSYVADEQIQVSTLRIMPYNKQTRMPAPIIETEGESQSLADAEIFIRPPETLPRMYWNNVYIMYTTDGSVPTSVNGTRYNPNDKPKITRNTNLKAVLCHLGRFDSEVVERNFIIDGNNPLLPIEDFKRAERVRGAERPSGLELQGWLKMSGTPLMDSSRPSSNNPYVTGSFHMPTPGRLDSIHFSSNPEDIF
eukprot:TRINITY_DN6009_c0_g2_i4.p1 TRINITY_DN6009_c0_g2~~TRINITY_DN6009_c0_g2_i4.p1  ORF type:complete len:278 (+),score=66.82 TRINITY_DN6009_c0_g2_i4:157-990(+)